MEVYFVDVGLGSCHVILLGDRRAIVIDCGVRSDHIALQFLLRNGVKTIDRLITSHSDGDHSSGAVSILNNYAENIEKICVIQDHKLLQSSYWKQISALHQVGRIVESQFAQPMVLGEKPLLIWEDQVTGARLRCFSPTFLESLSAQSKQNSNATSTVLVLDHQDRKIVFAADSVIPQWKQIYERRGNQILECDVLAVPHHGGHMDDKSTDLDWLYDQAVRADVAILSVGTVKRPTHPRPVVVTKLRSVGSTVLCTEITNQCHHDPASLKPGVLQPQSLHGRAINGLDQQWVACAGTIQVTITDNECRIEGLSAHQQEVDDLAAASDHGICPLCRRS